MNLLKDGALGANADHGTNDDEEMKAFDGKNPFADDSLWQIPVHLVRDLGANLENGNDNMAKSASETSGAADSYADDMANEDNNDNMAIGGGPTNRLQPGLSPSASSSPTVISASTDLKTAAGYHYPTHGEHHGYGHDSHSGYGADHHGSGSGHHGGHYGGSDHYGKYFQ